MAVPLVVKAAFVVVCTSLASCMIASEDFSPKVPEKRCTRNGQFLLHPADRCKFIHCIYGPKPRDDKGTFTSQYFGVSRDCPDGTVVPRYLYESEDSEDGGEDALKGVSALCAAQVDLTQDPNTCLVKYTPPMGRFYKTVTGGFPDSKDSSHFAINKEGQRKTFIAYLPGHDAHGQFTGHPADGSSHVFRAHSHPQSVGDGGGVPQPGSVLSPRPGILLLPRSRSALLPDPGSLRRPAPNHRHHHHLHGRPPPPRHRQHQAFPNKRQLHESQSYNFRGGSEHAPRILNGLRPGRRQRVAIATNPRRQLHPDGARTFPSATGNSESTHDRCVPDPEEYSPESLLHRKSSRAGPKRHYSKQGRQNCGRDKRGRLRKRGRYSTRRKANFKDDDDMYNDQPDSNTEENSQETHSKDVGKTLDDEPQTNPSSARNQESVPNEKEDIAE